MEEEDRGGGKKKNTLRKGTVRREGKSEGLRLHPQRDLTRVALKVTVRVPVTQHLLPRTS